MTGVVVGEDGVPRCPWGNSAPEYRHYHDHEWGLPVGDDQRIFEKLCLEGFQAGLSWFTLLRKREGFRRAFANFDPQVLARFGPQEVDWLLDDPSIVRHRAKIEATIANARALLRLGEQKTSLAKLLWSHEPEVTPPPTTMTDLMPATVESKSLSAELRARGFRFVGPITVYAAMQSLGVVNDHLAHCHHRSAAETARAAFKRPL